MLKGNGENLESIFKAIEAKGYKILYSLREKVRYPKAGRLSQIEVNQIFTPTQEALDWALFDTRTLAKAMEDVAGKDRIEQVKEELAFASLHRSFHEGKRILIFDRTFENAVIELKSQFIAGQIYKQNLWDRVLNHSTFSDARYKDILKITLEILKSAGFTALSFKPLFFQGVYNKLFGQNIKREPAAEQSNNTTTSREGDEKKKGKTKYNREDLIKLGEQAMDLSYLNPIFCKNLILYLGEFRNKHREYEHQWPLIFNSTYRDAKNQARVMVDDQLIQYNGKLPQTYRGSWLQISKLINELYHEGNSVYINNNLKQQEKITELSSNKIHQQKFLKIFSPYFNNAINIKNNPESAKNLLEKFTLNYTDYGLGRPSSHMKYPGEAVDISVSGAMRGRLENFLLDGTKPFSSYDEGSSTYIHISYFPRS